MAPYLNTFNNLLPDVSDIRRAGSASLDLAYVACGRLDGFWEASLESWDMAAGVLMIQEAGGFLCDFNKEKHYLDNGNIIAANGKLFKELSKRIIDVLHD